MHIFIEKIKYINLVAVISLLLSSIGAFGWAAFKTARILISLVSGGGTADNISVKLIEIIDAFLIALALYMFAVSLYEMFIGKLDIPGWMLAHNFDELKVRLGGVLILVVSVYLAERVIDGSGTLELLYGALAFAVVTALLVALSAVSHN